MKKLIIIAALFLIGAINATGQTMTIVNNSACSVILFFWAHDGGSYSSAGALSTVAPGPGYSIASSTTYGPVNITALNCGACVGPRWTGGPYTLVTNGSGWDAVKVNVGGCYAQLFSGTGYGGGVTSETYPVTCCGGNTVTWSSNANGDVTITIN